jgi:hypothetical protein
MRIVFLSLLLVVCLAAVVRADDPLFDMEAILDASTLNVEVLQDWHEVDGAVPTRQKLVTIRVGELWPGQDYRVPVRMIVPAGRKAKGFHLTGGHQTAQLHQDARPRGIEVELLRGGVGLVYTVVQTLKSQGQPGLDRAMYDRFIKTLDPQVSIQYWGWPASLMRAATAAYAETDHFEKGRIALSGGSKNGASPSVAIIHDRRMTALHATVSPPWESPLRLCDREAWDELEAFNRRDGDTKPHAFLGGTFGPVYNRDALAAGHRWGDLQKLADDMAGQVFISRNLEALKARGVEMLFEPGTHDFVCYDLAWGGAHYPQIPVCLRPNSGHGIKNGHPKEWKGVRNRDALLLGHFFDGADSLLRPPTVTAVRKDGKLTVIMTFPKDSMAESGRIWWMYDRAPDGSAAYLRDLIPDENWRDMELNAAKGTWTAEIELDSEASRIDFFSSHRKTVRHESSNYTTCISSPYTRIMLLKK